MHDGTLIDPSLINAPIGQPGSGRLRYGAAMALWLDGKLTAGALEVYRVCSARDGDDPARLLAERNEATPPLRPVLSPEKAVAALIREADQYLSSLPGPGVADVRAGLARTGTTPSQLPPTRHPVVDAYLPAVLAALMPDYPTLAFAIAEASPHLHWQSFDGYDPAEIGADFMQGQAYCTLTNSAEFDLGLFLIAPHILYRDHSHPAPELYAPLTGPHGWRFRPDAPLVIKPAHMPVWNDPHRPHLIKTGPAPFFCIYGWTADVNEQAVVIPANDWAELEALRLEASDV